MNKRVKKDLIYLLIGLTIAFGICFAIFDIIIEDGVKDQNMQNASFKERLKDSWILMDVQMMDIVKKE